MLFDASTLTAGILPDVQYTDSEFLDEIRSKTQAILKRTFPESFQKQQIRTDSNGLVFACPYCHDSATNVIFCWMANGPVISSASIAGASSASLSLWLTSMKIWR